MRDILIGIDAGTSVMKSVAFDLAGRQLAVASLPNHYETTAGGAAEQDMARTWDDCARTLRLLGEAIPDLAGRVLAVSVTAQGDGTWLIDDAGEPVGKAWLWLDARAATIVDERRARGDDDVRFRLTGTGLAACQQAPQLMAMRRDAPGRLAEASTAFHCKDWLYFRMTGIRATDPSEACFTYGNFRTRDYDEAVLDILDMKPDRRLLPEIVDGLVNRHGLSPQAAAVTGLLPGTPVVLSYVDILCTALGAGLFDTGARPGCTIIGSTGMHMRMTSDTQELALNEDRTGYTMCMPIPGYLAQVQSNMAATLNIDWVLGLAKEILGSEGISRTGAELLAFADRCLAGSRPAALLYQPYVSEAGERGPFIDANARAGFIGISSRHSYADMVRSVFEGLAFASRDCYEAMGHIPPEIRLAGGAARSAALRRILAAVLNSPVRTSRREETGAAGAAMIAAVSLGVYATMDACSAEWAAPFLDERENPDDGLAGSYESAFAVFKDARTAIRPVWKSFAAAHGMSR